MPGAVYSGRGALRKIREITEGRFKKAALFTDQGVEQAGLLKIPLEILNEAGVETVVITDLPAEPNCDEAEQVMERFRRIGADIIVAAGGGSVMDVAKLASGRWFSDSQTAAGRSGEGKKVCSNAYDSDDSGNRF